MKIIHDQYSEAPKYRNVFHGIYSIIKHEGVLFIWNNHEHSLFFLRFILNHFQRHSGHVPRRHAHCLEARFEPSHQILRLQSFEAGLTHTHTHTHTHTKTWFHFLFTSQHCFISISKTATRKRTLVLHARSFAVAWLAQHLCLETPLLM